MLLGLGLGLSLKRSLDEFAVQAVAEQLIEPTSNVQRLLPDPLLVVFIQVQPAANA